MKKLVFAVLAIGAMAACTKVSVQHEQPGEISLQPVAAKATKAAVDGTTYPTDLNFNVWAWYDDANVSDTPVYADYTTTMYINAGTFTNRTSSTNWGGVTPYYWPEQGSLVFAGYSPALDATAGTFAYNLNTLTFTATDYVQSTNISATADLMWFDAGKSYSANLGTATSPIGVPAVFKHALSWLTFKFALKESETPQNWIIRKVELTAIATKANFTSKDDKVVVDGNKTYPPKWSDQTVNENITVWTGDHTVTVTETALESTPNGVVIIPQPCVAGTDSSADPAPQLVITYDLKNPAYKDSTSGVEEYLTGQKAYLTLTADDDAWQVGKHYIYTIKFGANEILVSPTITDWTDKTVDINVQ